MRYEVIFFDADNTLFDYDRAEGEALERTFLHYGIPVTPDMRALYRRINKKAWEEFEKGALTLKRLRSERFRRLFEELGLSHPPEEVSTFYLDRLSEGSHLIENALPVLQQVAAVCTCCVVTNGIAEVQRRRFAASPVLDYVKGVVISEEVGSQKPDAGIYEAAMDLCGRPPKERVLMVGDSLTSDILGGIRFGIDTCWYNPSGKTAADGIQPAMEITEITELIHIVDGTRADDQ